MTARGLAGVLAAAALAATAVPAAAQSKRYPPPAVDPDDVAEHESTFWARAADPGRARYDELVHDAVLTARGDRRRAAELLRAATEARPDRVEAWGYLGLLADQVRDWAGCAEAYGRAVAIAPAWKPERVRAPAGGIGVALSGGRTIVVAHAMCRARAGDLAGAIAALQAVIARGEAGPRADTRATGELWLRLGETYLAAGRLDDAATAFAETLVLTSRRDTEAAWLLAVALDRARRTSQAEAAAADAQRIDPSGASATASNRPPTITPGEREYLLGLAARTPPAGDRPGSPAPERALIYFRRFLELVPADSPWRARAAEHVAAVEGVDLAARLELTGGSLGDRAVVERAVRARLPELRACLAPLPTVLLTLRITQDGPAAGPARPVPSPPARPLPSPPVEPPRPIRGAVRGPVVRPADAGRPDDEQPGVFASKAVTFERQPAAPIEDALACVERVGTTIALPRPPAGSYATVRVPVAAR